MTRDEPRLINCGRHGYAVAWAGKPGQQTVLRLELLERTGKFRLVRPPREMVEYVQRLICSR